MTTLTCEKCEETWSFEPGLAPPEGWEHGCQDRAPDLTARDMEADVAKAVRELKGRTGTERWMRSQSPTLRGVRLALDPDEFKTFMRWVKQVQTLGAISVEETEAQ